MISSRRRRRAYLTAARAPRRGSTSPVPVKACSDAPSTAARFRRRMPEGGLMADERYASIRMHAISVGGGLGAVPLIAILVTVMLVELEPLRPLVLTMALGVIFGVWRIRRRRRSGGSAYESAGDRAPHARSRAAPSSVRLQFAGARRAGGAARGRRCLDSAHTRDGRRRPWRVACSNACAICSTLHSSRWRPTICRPTGRPAGREARRHRDRRVRHERDVPAGAHPVDVGRHRRRRRSTSDTASSTSNGATCVTGSTK